MTIRITGMNSGLDTDSIIQELVSAYKAKGDKIKKQQTKLSWTQDKWKALNTKVLKLYKSLDNMRFSAGYNMKKTSVSDTTKATVIAGKNAINGTQSLKIKSTAKSGYLTGGNLAKSSGSSTTLATLGYGKDAISNGTDPVDIKGTYRISGNGVTQDIEVNANTTIADFVSQLNNSGTGVQASYDDTNKRLFISSKATGEAADFKLVALDKNGSDALKAFGVNVASNTTSAEANAWMQYYDTANGKVDEDALKAGVTDLVQAKKDKETNIGLIEGRQTDTSLKNTAIDYLQAAIDRDAAIATAGGSKENAATLSQLASMSEADRDQDYVRDAADGSIRLATAADKANGVATINGKTFYDSFGITEKEQKKDEQGNVVMENGKPVEVETEAFRQLKAYGSNAAKAAAYEADPPNDLVAGAISDSNKTGLRDQYQKDIEQNNKDIEGYNTALAAAEQTIKDNSILDGKDVTANMDQAAIDTYVAKLKDRVQYFHDNYTADKDGNYVLNSDQQSEGANKINGTDAEIYLNGAQFKSDSNTFNINGLTIQTLAATGDDEELQITTATDTQGLYDKIKDFLTEYNSIISEMSSLYNADSAKGYEPLTSEEKEALSESEVADWEKKIKDSLLRRDSNLGSLISTMTAAMSSTVEIGGKKYSLASLGIKTDSYFNSTAATRYMYHIDGDEDDETTSTNEDKLMAMLNSDPDKVIDIMKGVTNKLYDTLNKQMKPTTLRTYQTIYNDKSMAISYSDYTKKIAAWEEKVAKIEDDYYKKFSAMETALGKLQSQQSALAGLLGS